jgi:hypothetical protein
MQRYRDVFLWPAWYGNMQSNLDSDREPDDQLTGGPHQWLHGQVPSVASGGGGGGAPQSKSMLNAFEPKF